MLQQQQQLAVVGGVPTEENNAFLSSLHYSQISLVHSCVLRSSPDSHPHQCTVRKFSTTPASVSESPPLFARPNNLHIVVLFPAAAISTWLRIETIRQNENSVP